MYKIYNKFLNEEIYNGSLKKEYVLIKVDRRADDENQQFFHRHQVFYPRFIF